MISLTEDPASLLFSLLFSLSLDLLPLAAVSLLETLHPCFADFGVSGKEGLQIVGLDYRAELDLVFVFLPVFTL